MDEINYYADAKPSRLSLYGFSQRNFTYGALRDALSSGSFNLISFKTQAAKQGWIANFALQINSVASYYELRFELKPSLARSLYQNKDSYFHLIPFLDPIWSITLTTTFSYYPTLEWQYQLKILSVLSCDANFFADHNALTFFSIDRLNFLAKLPAPPSFGNIYKQEVIQEDFLWAHTHGLSRCAGLELEMMGIRSFEESLSSLLDATSAYMLSGALTKNHRSMVISPNLKINLIKWQTALKFFPSDIPGALPERQDALHRVDSLVIYAKKSSAQGLLAADFFLNDLRSGIKFLTYPSFVLTDMQSNATYLWPKIMRFIDTFGGDLRLKVSMDSTLNWYQFKTIKKGSIIIESSISVLHTIVEQQIYDWRLIAGQNIYGPEDFFQLNESIKR